MRVIVTKTEEYIFDHTNNMEEVKEMFIHPDMSHAYRDVSQIGGSTKIISIKEWQPKVVNCCLTCSYRLQMPKEIGGKCPFQSPDKTYCCSHSEDGLK